MAGEDRDYVAWIKGQPCAAAGMGDACSGAIEAHHAGRKGLSQRAHDRTCVPLCVRHHRAWHDLRPPFLGMDRYARRDWADRMIGRHQEAHAQLRQVAFAF